MQLFQAMTLFFFTYSFFVLGTHLWRLSVACPYEGYPESVYIVISFSEAVVITGERIYDMTFLSKRYLVPTVLLTF